MDGWIFYSGIFINEADVELSIKIRIWLIKMINWLVDWKWIVQIQTKNTVSFLIWTTCLTDCFGKTKQKTSLLHLGLLTCLALSSLFPLTYFLSEWLICFGLLLYFKINYSEVACMLLNCFHWRGIIQGTSIWWDNATNQLQEQI